MYAPHVHVHSNVLQWFISKLGIRVQQWLDTLRLLYWYSTDAYAMAQLPTTHPVTREVTGQRPSGQDLQKLRMQLFRFMQISTSEQVVEDDVHAIVSCVVESKDDLHVTEVLRFFLHLITAKHARMYSFVMHFLCNTVYSRDLGAYARCRRVHMAAETVGA